MHEQPPTTTRHVPHLPPLGIPSETRTDQKAIGPAASREAARHRDLNRQSQQRPPAPPDFSPVLPEDHTERLAKLDDEIYRCGIAVDRAKLVSLGKSRFSQLLEPDREARKEQRVIGLSTDFTQWESVFDAFARAGGTASPVPRRKTPHIILLRRTPPDWLLIFAFNVELAG